MTGRATRWTGEDGALLTLARMSPAERDATVRGWVDNGGWRATRWWRALFAPSIRRRVEAAMRAPEEPPA